MTIFLLSFVSAECFDTDNGKNKYELGAVTDNSETYQDVCEEDNIKEYSCNVDGVATYSILPCVNGCEEGECQLANQQLTYQAPEDEKESNMKFYFYAIALMSIVGLYLYWFKIRKRRR